MLVWIYTAEGHPDADESKEYLRPETEATANLERGLSEEQGREQRLLDLRAGSESPGWVGTPPQLRPTI